MSKYKNEIDETKKKKSILQTDIKDIVKVEVSPKAVIMIMLVMVFIGLYGYFMVYPKFEEYKSASNNVEMANQELNDYQKKLEEKPQLEKNIENWKKKLELNLEN